MRAWDAPEREAERRPDAARLLDFVQLELLRDAKVLRVWGGGFRATGVAVPEALERLQIIIHARLRFYLRVRCWLCAHDVP